MRDAVARIEVGHYDADLGGGLYKQRIARKDEGRSGGYRVILCFKHGGHTFFLYGFPKSRKANIDSSEKADLKKLSKIFFNMDDNAISTLLRIGSLQEINEESHDKDV